MRLALTLLALTTVAGCDSYAGQSDRLELVVDQTHYTAGDEALLVLDNDTGRDQVYGACLVLIGPDSNQPVSDGRACLDVGFVIRPGQSVPLRFKLPADLTAGTYVIALDLSAHRGVRTGRFEVVPAG